MTAAQAKPSGPAQPAAASAPKQDDGLLDQVLEATIDRLDSTAASFARQLGDPMLGRLRRSVLTGVAISRLRKMVGARR